MMRAVVISAMVILPSAAAAQTVAGAAQSNLALAAQLCLQTGIAPQNRAANFRAAGFDETVNRSAANSDTTHMVTAPANTVTIELCYGEQPGYCAVRTDFVDVTIASQILDQIMPVLRQGYRRMITQGGVNPSTGTPVQCISYEDPTNPIGEVIGVFSATQACTSDGTSQIYSSYRV